MKKFLKKASVYLLLLLLIAAGVFSLNYFLGHRLTSDLENEIEEIAAENNYQLRYLSIKSNPLLRRVDIDTLSLLKNNEQSYEINGAKIEFSWQQIFNYIKEREFLTKKDIKADIDKFSFYDLQRNNHFDFFNTELSYQGGFNSEDLKKPLELIKNDHKLTVLSEELNYDYPFYRSYGIDKNNWEQISTFNNFAFAADYQSQNNRLLINDFMLKNEFIDYELNFETVIERRLNDTGATNLETKAEDSKNQRAEDTSNKTAANFEEIVIYSDQAEKIVLQELKSNYSLALNGEFLNISKNDFFNKFSFSELNLDSDFEMYLNSKNSSYQFQKFDLDFDLSDFKLGLQENLSQRVNESSFGILAQNKQFQLNIESLNYQQNYSHPQGKSQLNLKSNLIDADLNAEFNLNNEIPYISNSLLKFKSKNQSVEQLLLFAQLLYGDSFKQDDEGYYYIESWGSLDNLKFE
jgi:hypothetical protein